MFDGELSVAHNKLGMRKLGFDVEEVCQRGRANPLDLMVGEDLVFTWWVEAELGRKDWLLGRIQRGE